MLTLNRTQRCVAYVGAAGLFAAATYLSAKAAWHRADSFDVAIAFVVMAIGAEAFKATLAPIMLGKGYGFKTRTLAAGLFTICLAFASLNALHFTNTGNTERVLHIVNEQSALTAHAAEKSRLEGVAKSAKTARERREAEARLTELQGARPTQYTTDNPTSAWLQQAFGIATKHTDLALALIPVILLELGSALGFTLAHAGAGSTGGTSVTRNVAPAVTLNPVLEYLAEREGETFNQRQAAADLGVPLKALHVELHRLADAGEIVLTTTKAGSTVTIA